MPRAGRRSLLGCACLLALAAGEAAARQAPVAQPAPDYGLTTSSTTLAASAFLPASSSASYDTLSSDLSRTDYPASATPVEFWAPLVLPTGVEVLSFTVEACNDSAHAMTAALVVCPFSGPCDDSRERVVSPGVGCGLFPHDLAAPLGIANGSNHYSLRILDSDGQPSRFRAVRVFWRRRPTPLDGIANFTDVPLGHPLRRYVEALAASQIALACGSGRFCPDDPVTRGQFAVYLARALGLHFEN